MVEWGDEDRVIDLVRIEANERTVRGWIKALRVVREELFHCAAAKTNRGDMQASVRLLDAYSGLSHLGSMMEEAIGEGR